MFKRWINWLKGDAASDPVRPPQQRRRSSAHAALRALSTPTSAASRRSEVRDIGSRFEGSIKNADPGKKTLISDFETIDDTGARETLKLFDSSPLDPNEPVGIDPYNSGQFDRSRNWNSRFRK